MNKPSISDIARKNNSARVSKFASSIVPAAPEVDTPQPEAQAEPVVSSPPQPPDSLSEVIERGETDFEQGRGVNLSPDELRNALPTDPAPVSKGASRKRAGSNVLSMDDILGNKAPDDETFAKMTRIAEKHHDLLRKLAFETRKPMNTILYNLLEVLDQTYQRKQQNDV